MPIESPIEDTLARRAYMSRQFEPNKIFLGLVRPHSRIQRLRSIHQYLWQKL